MKDTILNIVRVVLVGVGSIFVAKGQVDNGIVETVVGGVVAVVGGIWQIVAFNKAKNEVPTGK